MHVKIWVVLKDFFISPSFLSFDVRMKLFFVIGFNCCEHHRKDRFFN